jgi:hypothetical protein
VIGIGNDSIGTVAAKTVGIVGDNREEGNEKIGKEQWKRAEQCQ